MHAAALMLCMYQIKGNFHCWVFKSWIVVHLEIQKERSVSAKRTQRRMHG